jgi:hypothetical protein
MAKRGRPRKGETREKAAINEEYQRRTNHPLLRAFDKEQYVILPCDGGYCLYDRNKDHKRANAQYIGRFYISTNGTLYAFNNNYFSDTDSLIKAMDEYNATLPFSPEIYDPTYRKSFQIELALHDYLINIGFKQCPWKECSTRQHDSQYEIADAYGHKLITIIVDVEFDTSKGMIRRLINEDTWQECPFHDLDSAIAACNSILAGYFSVVQAQLMNALNKLTSARAALILDKHFDWKTLSTYSEDATQKTIEYLEAELKRLKRE